MADPNQSPIYSDRFHLSYQNILFMSFYFRVFNYVHYKKSEKKETEIRYRILSLIENRDRNRDGNFPSLFRRSLKIRDQNVPSLFLETE